MKQLRFPLVATHIAGWLLFQSLPLVFLLAQSRYANLFAVLASWQYWQFCIYYIIVFYLHSYLLLPKFFIAQKKIIYVTLMLVLLFSVFWLQPFDKLMNVSRNRDGIGMMSPPAGNPERRGPRPGAPPDGRFGPPPGEAPSNKMRQQRGGGPGSPGHIDIISIILFVMIITLSIAVDVTRRWRETMQLAARAEADRANAELSFLKAQINPHFLFNTLNNIYSMAVTKSEHTASTIMKLSNIMRYVTDDVNENFVSLQNEVDCITDYVDLQKLRLGKKVSLEFTVTGDLEYKKISPLVLMTFIENVFKYGISNHEQSHLVIKLTVGEERIDFLAQNPLFATDRKIERTGIGIDNTRKRLEHLYPGKHTLEITRANGLFTVALSLYK